MVTIVFTDLVNSTLLKSTMPGADITARNVAYWNTILKPHRERLQTALAQLSGRLIKTEGDAYVVAFTDVIPAVNWVVAVQTSHSLDPINTPLGPLKVKIGMHSGNPLVDPDDNNDFVGREVDYAARIGALASGGQVAASEVVASLVKAAEITGVMMHAHGARALKGIGRVPVFELLFAGKQPQDLLVDASAPNNIPREEHNFVGRMDVLREIDARIEKGGVIILRGEGGIGKTAIALHIAKVAYERAKFPVGIVWIDCEVGRSRDECLREITRVLCGDRFDGQDIQMCEQHAFERLNSGRALLVFDGFEMIGDHVALSRWISGLHSPHCVLITTQKTWSHMQGDVVPIFDLSHDEATDLFVARATQAGVNVLGQLDLVSRLCEVVGYLPLAIELLASRAARTPLSRLLERAANDLAVLDATEDISRPARHQSIRACIRISYEPLSDKAKALLMRLAILPDGASPDLVSAITKSPGWDEQAEELVCASVCRIVSDRYRMHSLIRRFAVEQAANQIAEIKHEVAVALSSMARERAEKTRPGSASPSVMLDALDWIESEWQNVVACGDIGFESKDFSTVRNIEATLQGFYLMRGRWEDCEKVYQRSLAIKLDYADQTGEAETLMDLGRLYERQGKWSAAQTQYQACLERYQKIGDAFGQARVLNNMGIIYRHQHRWTDAESVLLEALEIRREVRYSLGAGRTLNNLGLLYEMQERFEESEKALTESLGLFKEYRDHLGEGEVLNNIGTLRRSQGKLTAAEEMYKRSLKCRIAVGDSIGEARTLFELGLLYNKMNKWPEAQDCFQRCLAIRRHLGDNLGEGRAAKASAQAHQLEGRFTEALRLAKHAEALLGTTEDEHSIAEVEQLLNELNGARG